MAKKPCCTFYFRFRCLLASLLKIRRSFFNILVKFRFRPNHIFILAIRIIFYYSQIKCLIKSTPVISKCTRLKAWFWIVGFFFYLFHSLSGINKFPYTCEKSQYRTGLKIKWMLFECPSLLSWALNHALPSLLISLSRSKD